MNEQHATTSPQDIEWREKHGIKLTNKQRKAKKQRDQNPRTSLGYQKRFQL